MNILFVGPIIRTGPRFAYPTFDGKTVAESYSYQRIDQARYARDREAGRRIETMDAFEGAVAPLC